MAGQSTGDFRRILVALDASSGSLAALEEAAQLASRLEAELSGLFIEDIDLLNLAALPFSREAPTLARTGRMLDPATIERELRCKAGQARRAMERIAQSRHLRWSFRVARGRVETEIKNAAQEVDLVAVGQGMRPLSRSVKWGQTARALAMSSTRPILFTASRAAPPDAPILTWYMGTEASRHALAAAARLAGRDGRKLVVFLNSSDPDELAKLELSASRVLPPIPSPVVYRHSAGADIDKLVRLQRVEHFGLFIVDATTLGGDIEGNLSRLVVECGCSILLLRG
jgi:nucleotide-binding universal stress UspA family protein